MQFWICPTDGTFFCYAFLTGLLYNRSVFYVNYLCPHEWIFCYPKIKACLSCSGYILIPQRVISVCSCGQRNGVKLNKIFAWRVKTRTRNISFCFLCRSRPEFYLKRLNSLRREVWIQRRVFFGHLKRSVDSISIKAQKSLLFLSITEWFHSWLKQSKVLRNITTLLCNSVNYK